MEFSRNPVIKIGVTQDALNMMNQLHHGDLIFDTATGFYYCKSNIDKYSIVVEREFEPCLGSNCDKRKYCYKYNLSQKFDKNKFILSDLSDTTEQPLDEYGNMLHEQICCSRENKYRYFRWDE